MVGHVIRFYIYKLLSQEAKDALQKYNVEAIQKFTIYNLQFTLKLQLFLVIAQMTA